ncbi:imv membrane protein, virion maturation [Pteropox virus]|uniref:Imv membrane protein, virion maturation n=1 Tax=Pteropox virus TaxID=1873698 RepID=A0A1B1MRH2_9POXV|nr:imv membrane protein, virion maturation [Pteropox virus]ANS71191.1 imv membrane protein, virion maturation [Pteropox virus]
MALADLIITFVCIIIIIYLVYNIYTKTTIEKKNPIVPEINKGSFNDKLTNDQIKAIAKLVSKNSQSSDDNSADLES